jgi:hypothetical protein
LEILEWRRIKRVFWVQGNSPYFWRIISVAVGAKNPLLGGARGGFLYNFVSPAINYSLYSKDPTKIANPEKTWKN